MFELEASTPSERDELVNAMERIRSRRKEPSQ